MKLKVMLFSIVLILALANSAFAINDCYYFGGAFTWDDKANQMVDECGNASDATNSGTTNTSGVPYVSGNSARSFSTGSSQYIDMGEPIVLDTNNFTIALYFKTTTTSVQYIVDNTITADNRIFIRTLANGTIDFFYDDGPASWHGYTDNTYNDGAWHSLVVTRWANETMQGWIDNATVFQTSGVGDISASGSIFLGKQLSSGYFNGQQDTNLFLTKSVKFTEVEEFGLCGDISCSAPPAPSNASYFEITADNLWNGSALTTFRAEIVGEDNYTVCYQEFANTSTCGYSQTEGNYSLKPTYMYINYSIPQTTITETTWYVKFGDDGLGNPITENITLDGSCDISGNILQLRFYSYYEGNLNGDTKRSYGQCYTGSSWNTITSNSLGVGTSGVSSAAGSQTRDGNYSTQALWNDGASSWSWEADTGDSDYAQIFEEAIYWTIANYATTNGTIVTDILSNSSSLYDVIIIKDGYYNNTHTYVNVSSDLNSDLYRAIANFNASLWLFNLSVDANITVNGSTKTTDEFFYMDIGEFTATVAGKNLNTRYYTFSIEALANASYVVENITNTIANITSYEKITGNQIPNFNVTIYNLSLGFNQTYEVTGNNLSIQLVNATFGFYAAKEGYGYPDYVNQTMNYGWNNVSTYLRSLVDVFINLFEEETLDTVTNVWLEILSDAYSSTYYATTSSFNFTDLPVGDYEIRFGVNDSTYYPRSYFYRLPHVSLESTNISLYFINQTEGTIFTRTILNENSQPLTNGLLQIQRAYTSTDNSSVNYRTVEIAEIDSQGNAVFHAIPNTQAYRFRILQNYSLLATKSPSYLVESTQEITVRETSSLVNNYIAYRTITSSLTYQNSSQNYIFDYTVSDDLVENMCMDVVYTYGTTTSITTSCSEESSDTITIFANSTLNGTFFVSTYTVIDGDTYVVDTTSNNFRAEDTQAVFGIVGAILYVLVLIVCATIAGFNNPIPGVILGILATIIFGFGFLGIFGITALAQGILIVIGLVILFLGLRR